MLLRHGALTETLMPKLANFSRPAMASPPPGFLSSQNRHRTRTELHTSTKLSSA